MQPGMGLSFSQLEEQAAMGCLYCLRCGYVVEEVHCKLICPRCGATRDCSDG